MNSLPAKVVLTGAGGQVGKELMRLSGGKLDVQVIGMGHFELDVTSPVSISNALNIHKPDVLVNTAAYTAVEKAESEIELAFEVNGNGAEILAQICAERQIPLIHLSTDYVFDGKKKQPYTEIDTENPINIYGKSKYEGEKAIRSVLNEHIILRTSWVFGIYGHNFVKTLLKLQKKRSPLNIISDTIGCPTAASDIAMVIIQLVSQVFQKKQMQWGTYHYCGDNTACWYSFAKEVFKTVSMATGSPLPQIIPISSEDYPSVIQRPANTALSCQKIKNAFGISPCNWEKGVQKVVNTLMNKEQHM